MIGSPAEIYQSIIALNMALGGNLEFNLTTQDSEQNIIDNLVTICSIEQITSCSPFDFIGSSHTGLRITTDGFIILPYHCIKGMLTEWDRINEEYPADADNINEWKREMVDRYCVMDNDGSRYPIDFAFRVVDVKHDIALIKAMSDNKPRPVLIKMLSQPVEDYDELKICGKQYDSSYCDSGCVIRSTDNTALYCGDTKEVISIEDIFTTDIQISGDFTGGALMTVHGELAGLAMPGQEDSYRTSQAKGIKVINIFCVVKMAAYSYSKAYLDNPPTA